MINKQHYRAAFEALEAFNSSALNRIGLFLTEKEFLKLNRKFKNFVFAYNPDEHSEFKTYTIFKKCNV